MSFFNPLALWLLLIVPIVFLARRRPVRQRVPVANLYLWKVATPSGTSALTRRFRRHWLFVLQALVLVALILAIARPLMSIGVRAAVIIDVSLSMSARDGTRTRLDEAKARADSFIRELPWGARVRVITAGASPRDLGEFRASDAGLARTLDAIRPSVESSDLAAAIQLARSVSTPPGHIEVLSDLSSPSPPGPSSDIGWSVIGKPADNVAVTALGVSRTAGTAHALLSVTNYSNAVASRAVVLEQGDRALTRERIEIPPGRTQTVSVLSGIADGTLTARIDGDDALPEDDQRQVNVTPLRRLRVLLTGGGFFLEQALRSHPDVDVTVDASKDGSYDVIVCGACSDVPSGNSSVLLIPPPDDSQTPAAITVSAVEHPLVDGVGFGDLAITPVASRRNVEEGSVIATSGDLPAILAYTSAGRRVIEWRFNLTKGPVPLSPAFPLLVANALEWLTANDSPAANTDAANESDLRTTSTASVPTMVEATRASGRAPAGGSEVTVALLLLAIGTLVTEWRHRRSTASQV
jgi:hypothetical protein